MKYKVYCDNKVIAEFKYEVDRDDFIDDCEDERTFTTEEVKRK